MRTPILVSKTISTIAPEKTALRAGSQTLLYGDLNRQADELAERFCALGVGAAAAVAICLQRSFGQITAELAAMRAGAAFVPIDPAWPDERIETIVNDSGAAVFIAPAALSCRLNMKASCIDLESPTIAERKTVADGAALADLAYIIYTSGSTGVPKGVEITHANLLHLIDWHVHEFEVTDSDHATHVAGLGFDAAVWEVWPYLAVGATVSLAEDAVRVDSAALQDWLVSCGATIAFVPTPLAEPMLTKTWPAKTKLKTLLVGGDVLHAAPGASLPFRVVNNYGPTECTVVATSGAVTAGVPGVPTIGRAITGTSAYVLDADLQTTPDGEAGELYLGGNGVGRGYRNLPEQTASSFLADPFVAGGRMYKTGDMVKQLPGGEIAFLGRDDGQEKIRGNRIELAEIVSVLQRHEDVVANVVVASKDTGDDKHLIAYVQLARGANPLAIDLQDFLGDVLPGYMIPARFVRIESLPLTTNGKIDRKALPAPSEENLLAESLSREPQSDLEVTLLDLVRSLLKTNAVGVDDDFFLAGGHSLLGTQLVLRVREQFGVMLTLRDLFESSTVANLAERVEELILEEVSAMSEEDVARLMSKNE